MIPEATLKTKAPKGDSINKGAGSRANTYTLNPGYGEIIPAPFPSYPGSNEASGVPQTIINHIPQHEYYYELFLGNGTIARWKRPAHKSFLFDIDPGVIEQWKGVFLPEGFNLFCNSWQNVYEKGPWGKHSFFYLDPPYPDFTRSSKKPIYNFEMLTREEHEHFLECWRDVKTNVMISTYKNELYDQILKEWKVFEFDSMTRAGIRREAIYMNYDIEQLPLHDYRYLGADRRERERIRNKVKRWKDGLDRMERREREAILQYITQNP